MKSAQKSVVATLALAAIAFAAANAANAADLPDRIKKAGKIVAATQPNYPPIAYKDPATNTLTGFDIDLGEALAKELGVKIEWQETAFAQMISSLQTSRVDIALAGMSDLPARREVVDFVDYMKTGPQFFTMTSRGGELKTIDDLCGKKVGASRSTTEWCSCSSQHLRKTRSAPSFTSRSVSIRPRTSV